MVFLLAAALVLGFVTAPAGQQAAIPDPDQPLALVIRYANGRVVRGNVGPIHSSWTPMFPRIEGWTVARTIAFHLQRLKKEFIGEVVAARPRAGNVAATREWFDAAIAAYQDRLSDLSTC
ncbi:MAG: hypothetical protein Q8O42_16595 [Acidobacteriota bacterium]|nr:hypothetical protein [Acidobacteriota bacterium]